MSNSTDRPCARERAGIGLSRRSLIAAGALVTTLGSTSVANAFASSRKPKKGFEAQAPVSFGSNSNCFLRGTRLLAPAGEVAIENLSIGDLVVTHGGAERAIRWIGKIAIARDGAAAWPEHAMPVRIAKDAFAPASPHRDLYLSRAHLLYLNGVLIPVGNLVNGRTIRAVVPEVDVMHYFHVELDGHDVLLAEGAPCDSLRATAESRRHFDNYDEYVALFGPPAAAHMAPYAPIVSFNGGRSELKSRLRSALAPVVDIRRPMDVVRDNLEARALLLKAA